MGGLGAGGRSVDPVGDSAVSKALSHRCDGDKELALDGLLDRPDELGVGFVVGSPLWKILNLSQS